MYSLLWHRGLCLHSLRHSREDLAGRVQRRPHRTRTSDQPRAEHPLRAASAHRGTHGNASGTSRHEPRQRRIHGRAVAESQCRRQRAASCAMPAAIPAGAPPASPGLVSAVSSGQLSRWLGCPMPASPFACMGRTDQPSSLVVARYQCCSLCCSLLAGHRSPLAVRRNIMKCMSSLVMLTSSQTKTSSNVHDYKPAASSLSLRELRRGDAACSSSARTGAGAPVSA